MDDLEMKGEGASTRTSRIDLEVHRRRKDFPKKLNVSPYHELAAVFRFLFESTSVRLNDDDEYLSW